MACTYAGKWVEQAECNSLIKEDVSLKLMLDKINQSSCCQVSVF